MRPSCRAAAVFATTLTLSLPASHTFAHEHAASALAAAQGTASGTNEGGSPVIYVPQPDTGIQTLGLRQFEQLQSLWRFEVFHGFGFVDRQAESGITFQHQIVDDAGRYYKAVHYDHGNGVAAADVDLDGKTDLYFVSQLGGNELWKNVGDGRFKNITAEAGVALADRIGVTASFADVDNDGDPDLFVTTVKTGNALFENDGKGHFRDITQGAGLSYSGHSSGAVFFDYDKDGRLDLFLTNVGRYTTERKGTGGYFVGFTDAFSGHLFPERTERSILYRNLGGNRFEKANDAVGLNDGSWSGDASVNDLNGDGFPDLYVLNMQGDDHYYENQGGKRFVDKTAETFPKTCWGAMGIEFLDFEGDGDADLFVTDMHSDMSQGVPPGFEKSKSQMTWTDEFLQGGANNVFGNCFYRNPGSGPLEEVSDRVNAENYWPWGLSVGDLNADGWEDAFLTSSMNYPFRYAVNTLLLNNRGKTFLDSEFILGVEPRAKGMQLPWFDLDCSGADRQHDLCKGKSGRFTVHGTRGSRSSVMLDLEDDGDLDLVTLEMGDVPQVLVSNLSEKTTVRFLKVRLRGKASNRDGLGAKVTVVAGGRRLTQWNDGKSGYLAQSSLPLYFGLGEATAVEAIEIEWPSGRKQTVTEGLGVNRVVEVSE